MPEMAEDWQMTSIAGVLGGTVPAVAAADLPLPAPSFLERAGSDDLAGGHDFVETYLGHGFLQTPFLTGNGSIMR